MTDRVNLFDRWAATYDSSLMEVSGFPFEGYRAVLRCLFELAEPQPGQRVLDVGTGTGALAALYADAGCAGDPQSTPSRNRSIVRMNRS